MTKAGATHPLERSVFVAAPPLFDQDLPQIVPASARRIIRLCDLRPAGRHRAIRSRTGWKIRLRLFVRGQRGLPAALQQPVEARDDLWMRPGYVDVLPRVGVKVEELEFPRVRQMALIPLRRPFRIVREAVVVRPDRRRIPYPRKDGAFPRLSGGTEERQQAGPLQMLRGRP